MELGILIFVMEELTEKYEEEHRIYMKTNLIWSQYPVCQKHFLLFIDSFKNTCRC